MRMASVDLKLLSFRSLTPKQKRLGVFSFAANFERPEVFDPQPFRCVRFGLAPEFELVEIFNRNLPITQPVEEMIPQRRRQVGPLNPRHLIPMARRTSCAPI